MSEWSHQSTEFYFDTPRNEEVTRAIGQRIGLLLDLQPAAEPRHATGTLDAASIRCIERAYEAVAGPGLSEERAWERAFAHCTRTAAELIDGYRTEIASNRGTLLGVKLAEEAIHTVIAAVTMYAIDRQSGARTANKEPAIDAFFALGDEAHESIVDTAFSRIRKNKLTVGGSETHSAVLVGDLIEQRRAEIERNNYDDVVWLMHELADSHHQDKTRQAMQSLGERFARIRSAEHLTERDYDAYLLEVERAVTVGHYANAEALTALPLTYFEALHGRDCAASQSMERIFAACASQLDAFCWRPYGLLQAAEFYYPGGLAGDAASADPSIESICESYTQQGVYMSLFPKKAAGNSPEYTNTHNTTVEQVLARYCGMLFSDQQFAADYAQDLVCSLHERKWDKNGVPVYLPDAIHVVTAHLSDTLRSVGEETFVQVHRQFGLGAIDFFTPHNITVLAGLLNNDQAVIEKLQKSDVTLAMFDGYGSHNEAPFNIIHQLHSADPRTERIIAPWREPSDFYRMLALLKKCNVQFCNLVFAAHGIPGVVDFNRGNKKISLVSSQDVAARPHSVRMAIDQSQIERIAREYMRAPKHAVARRAAKTKQIIAAACSSDVPAENYIPSIAEAVLKKVDSPDTVVIGTSNVAYASHLHTDGKGLFLTGHAAGEPDSSNAPNTSNMVRLHKSPYSTRSQSKRHQKKTGVQRSTIKARVIV